AVLLDPARLRRHRAGRRPDVPLGASGSRPPHGAAGRRHAACRIEGRAGRGHAPPLSRPGDDEGKPAIMQTALKSTSCPAPDVPYYVPAGNELTLFAYAWKRRLPVLLRGPTGCGKTRFVAHMAAQLGLKLTTVSCHDDLAAADLTGRYLLR